MSKKPAKIEWQIEDEQSVWPPFPDSASPDSSPSAPAPKHPLYLYYSLAAILLLLLATGVWLWAKAQHGVTQIEGDLKEAAQTELWLAKNAPAQLPLDPAAKLWHSQFQREDNVLIALGVAKPDLAMDSHLKNMQNDVAAVDIVLHGKGDAQSYRQTRFYRQSATGWLRTAAAAAQWGPTHHLESTYFIFDFRQEDAQVVAATAPKVDALYTSLRNNLGLPGNSTRAKQRIEVSITALPGASITPLDTEQPWRVPSPSLYLAPLNVTDSKLLLQSLAFPLITRVLPEALQRYHFRSVWGPVAGALRLWQLWNLDLPLSSWRQEVVRWRYLQLPSAAYDQAPLLPNDYLPLCAMHALWMISPVQIGIPLPCNDPINGQDRALEIQPNASPLIPNGSRPPTTLSALIVAGALQDRIAQSGGYWNAQPDNTLALETLIECIVSTHGAKSLPIFLSGMATYDDWESLSRSTLGISSATLTAEWQAYLTKHYAVPIDKLNQSK